MIVESWVPGALGKRRLAEMPERVRMVELTVGIEMAAGVNEIPGT
jgi:hypothetical protein